MAKKKILLLADDLRIHSGIGTMSKAFVMGTLHKYDWVQMAGAIEHPEVGKMTDMSEECNKAYNMTDAYCKIYPVNGYGDQKTLRTIMNIEKPDGIMHFTDPRFWGWLYQMEHEIRQEVPIMYYNIWDDLPFPHWNENAYESCDGLMAISKQTYNINKNVCKRKPRVENKDVFYVPHGIDHNLYRPLEKDNKELSDFVKGIFNGREYDFTMMFNSRNIRRKGISNILSAYSVMTEGLPQEDRDKIALVLHTDPVDNNGTDLPATAAVICPQRNVIFSNQKMPSEALNMMYNMSDVVLQPSSAEGFGLSHMEAMMSGTPTIATVIGGLQDQMGFKIDGRDVTTDDFTGDVPSNSTGKMSKTYGEWVYPLWPNLSLEGSPPTPYIYDSRPTIGDIAKGMRYWYDMSKEEREKCGMKGRNWAIENGYTQEGMCKAMINGIDTTLSSFTPRTKYQLIDTGTPKPVYNTGVLL